jgi:putative ABC transport system ATP-binding protein
MVRCRLSTRWRQRVNKVCCAIHVVNLHRRYEMGAAHVDALRGVNLAVEQGEFVALVGPSGSGKSTLLNLIGGLDRPTEGEIWLNSVELTAQDERGLTAHRRHRVGFVFQSFNLLPRLTALENVALPLVFCGVPEQQRLARAQTLLGQVGLDDRLNHRPTQLSGGEQQRVAIARALVGEPALLLADEPTGNLDTATGGEIMALLKTLNVERGLTLLVVTHDPEVAAFADRIVRLRDGLVMEEGL